jgi:hypothetical protein
VTYDGLVGPQVFSACQRQVYTDLQPCVPVKRINFDTLQREPNPLYRTRRVIEERPGGYFVFHIAP